MDLKTLTKGKALPLLSFPSVQLLGISVQELISDSNVQAKGMKAIADRVPSAASVSLMDLSVEAECFGAKIRFSDHEVPNVSGAVIDPDLDEDERMEAAEALEVPEVGAGRTGIYIEAIRKAKELITDRPVIAGVIGPFSLAGRLVDVSSSLIYCLEEPEMLHVVLEKAASFIISYIKAYKEVGADGVAIAEPLAGLLSPSLAEEFSGEYMKKIVDAVKSDDFTVIYHNCGNTASVITEAITMAGCDAYHFGNAVDMKEIMEKMPPDVLCFGNIDPVGQLKDGTPESVREAVFRLLDECGGYDNFRLSSGCDIPPMAKWENLDAFFAAAEEYYAG